jgi:hypothetical protein
MLNFSKFINNFYLFKDKFKFQFLEFIKELAIKIYFIFIVLLSGLEWFLAGYILKQGEGGRIALHYNVDFGIDYYDSINKIYTLPILGILIIIINFLLSLALYRHRAKRFIFHLLLSIALLSNVIILSALISIYLVNFR